MFVNARDFSTSNSKHDNNEVTCGYLNHDDVKEFLGLMKTYTLDKDDEMFVKKLIEIFSSLVEKFWKPIYYELKPYSTINAHRTSMVNNTAYFK